MKEILAKKLFIGEKEFTIKELLEEVLKESNFRYLPDMAKFIAEDIMLTQREKFYPFQLAPIIGQLKSLELKEENIQRISLIKPLIFYLSKKYINNTGVNEILDIIEEGIDIIEENPKRLANLLLLLKAILAYYSSIE